jgi:hypothetical protein
MKRSPERSIVPACAALLEGVSPVSTSDISVEGTAWTGENRNPVQNWGTVPMPVVQQKVE